MLQRILKAFWTTNLIKSGSFQTIGITLSDNYLAKVAIRGFWEALGARPLSIRPSWGCWVGFLIHLRGIESWEVSDLRQSEECELLRKKLRCPLRIDFLDHKVKVFFQQLFFVPKQLTFSEQMMFLFCFPRLAGWVKFCCLSLKTCAAISII